MTRKEQALQTKSKIVSTIMRLLSENSFESLKVRDICKEAHISVGSFYHHFESKEAALIGSFSVFDEWLQKRLEKQTFSSNSDAILYICESYFLNSVYSGVNGTAAVLAVEISPTFPLNPDRYLTTQLLHYIEAGLQSGEFTSKYTPQETKDIVFRILRGVTFDWCLNKGNFNLLKAGDTMLRQTLNAVLPLSDV